MEIDYGLGTDEGTKKAIEAKDVQIIEVLQEKTPPKEGKPSKDKIKMMVRHPDVDKPIEISKVKHLKDDKLVVEGTWLSLDNEGKISKYSALGKLLAFYKCKTTKDLVGKVLKTTHDDKKYLVFKAYD